MKRLLLVLILATSSFLLLAQIHVSLEMPDPCNQVSIDENAFATDFDFSIYPNPSNGKFILETRSEKELGNLHILVINMEGKQVYSEDLYCQANQCLRQLKLTMLGNGIYNIMVVRKNEMKSQKLLIY